MRQITGCGEVFHTPSSLPSQVAPGLGANLSYLLTDTFLSYDLGRDKQSSDQIIFQQFPF